MYTCKHSMTHTDTHTHIYIYIIDACGVRVYADLLLGFGMGSSFAVTFSHRCVGRRKCQIRERGSDALAKADFGTSIGIFHVHWFLKILGPISIISNYLLWISIDFHWFFQVALADLSGHPRQGLQTLSAKNAKIICSDIDGLSFLVKASGSGMIEKHRKTMKKKLKKLGWWHTGWSTK